MAFLRAIGVFAAIALVLLGAQLRGVDFGAKGDAGAPVDAVQLVLPRALPVRPARRVPPVEPTAAPQLRLPPHRLSPADVLREFAASSFIQKEARAYEQRCAATRTEWRALRTSAAFVSLRRVLVIDVSTLGWNGLGNSLERWLNLFRLGHAHGRATFLRMDPCSPPLPSASGAEAAAAVNASTVTCKFDLGAHFEADGGWSWRWDQGAARRVQAALQPEGGEARGGGQQGGVKEGGAGHGVVRRLRYCCARVTWACQLGVLSELGSLGRAEPTAGPAGAGAGAAAAADAAASERPIGAPLAESAGAVATLLFQLFDEADALAASRAVASVVVLEITREQTSLQQELSQPAVRQRHPLYARGGFGLCERHALTRPTPALQRALLPALRALEGGELAVALHVRTGYADWQKYAPPPGADGAGAWAYAPPSHAAHWAELERLLRDCREASGGAPALPRPASEYAAYLKAARRLLPPFCFLYMMGDKPFILGRAVDATDAARCALGGMTVRASVEPPAAALAAARAVMQQLPAADGPAGARGPLAAAVACAAMHARRQLRPLGAHAEHFVNARRFDRARPAAQPLGEEELRARAALDAAIADDAPPANRSGGGAGAGAGVDARWRLIVLGDAPALHALLRAAPYLRGRAVTLAATDGSADDIGHTAFRPRCTRLRGRRRTLGGERCTRADPLGTWTRSVADLYLGGLASAMVRLLFSSYPGAVMLRSVLVDGRQTEFYADYHPRSAHRDVPPCNTTAFAVLRAAGPYRGDARAGP